MTKLTIQVVILPTSGVVVRLRVTSTRAHLSEIVDTPNASVLHNREFSIKNQLLKKL